MRLLSMICSLIVCATAVLAEDDVALFDLSSDAFRAGQTVRLDTAGHDDVFLAGERVDLSSGIAGSAHMAGRWLTVDGPVGADLYAAGQRVTVEAGVAGDATLAGQEIRVRGAVGEDLRSFGSEIDIAAPVGGSLLVGGEFLTWNAAVSGDVALGVREIDFGPEASVSGRLILFEDTDNPVTVPERVAPADRIERRPVAEWDEEWSDYSPVRPRSVIAGFLMGVLVVTLAAAAIAALAPASMARLRTRVLTQPWHALLAGFVTQSALIGSGVVLGLTLIGLLLLPAAIFVVLLVGFAGYVVGAYAFGVRLLQITGRHDPSSTGERAIAAGVGALAAGLIGLIPFLGWLFVLALTLAGAGAITLVLLRPRFFAEG